jgi:AraC-like DNA-binding protein
MLHNTQLAHSGSRTLQSAFVLGTPPINQSELLLLPIASEIVSPSFRPDFSTCPFSRAVQVVGKLPRTDFAARVRSAVSHALVDGIPTLSTIATELGVGARTLQRRLSESGHSFQGIVDGARRELAEQLLRETDYSLAEIAFLTGFSEQSGFTRAFKRWEGQTPRSYRLEVTSRQTSAPDTHVPVYVASRR